MILDENHCKPLKTRIFFSFNVAAHASYAEKVLFPAWCSLSVSQVEVYGKILMVCIERYLLCVFRCMLDQAQIHRRNLACFWAIENQLDRCRRLFECLLSLLLLSTAASNDFISFTKCLAMMRLSIYSYCLNRLLFVVVWLLWKWTIFHSKLQI